jgi:hypothetical protein
MNITENHTMTLSPLEVHFEGSSDPSPHRLLATSSARRRRVRFRSVAILSVAVLVLAISGCTVFDTSEPQPSTTSTPDVETTTGTPGMDALRFAQCMRENGIPEWQDPEPSSGNAGGPARTAVQAPEGVDPELLGEAMESCKQYLPEGGPGGSQAGTEEQQEGLLRYAQCMRDHGLADFPDPDEYGLRIPPGIDPESEEFTVANDACLDLLPAPQQQGDS